VLANDDSTSVRNIGIEAVPMYNITPDRLRYHQKGVGNAYVLDLAGTRVYVSGDTEDTPEMLALTAIDLAFLCMSLPASMSPAQAASAALVFQPAVVYPYHYGRPLPIQDPGIFKSIVEARSDSIEVRLREWYP
jgi:L-ascorbate metabolism protein UlaG (beta-lactamase superfamily)